MRLWNIKRISVKNKVCSLVSNIVPIRSYLLLIIVQWLCTMLQSGQAGWRTQGNALHNFYNSSVSPNASLKHVAGMIRKLHLKSNWVNWVIVTELERGRREGGGEREKQEMGGERYRSCVRTWKFGRREKVTIEFPSKWKWLVLTREQRHGFLSIPSSCKSIDH